MGSYLIRAKYTREGITSLIKEGASTRVAFVRRVVESFGGTLESMDFAFGDDDVFVKVTGPDNIGAAAASLFTASLGLSTPSVTVLLSLEEVDEACRRAASAVAQVQSRPPA